MLLFVHQRLLREPKKLRKHIRPAIERAFVERRPAEERAVHRRRAESVAKGPLPQPCPYHAQRPRARPQHGGITLPFALAGCPRGIAR